MPVSICVPTPWVSRLRLLARAHSQISLLDPLIKEWYSKDKPLALITELAKGLLLFTELVRWLSGSMKLGCSVFGTTKGWKD